MSQDKKKKPAPQETEVEQDPAPSTDGTAAALVDDTDALLDEIDGVLEENAQEFVQQYIQKGGE